MTDEARDRAWDVWIATNPAWNNTCGDGFDAGWAAGVAEGIRQAREAVAHAGPTWHRGMYGSPDDMYAAIAIQRAFEGLTGD